MNILEKTYRAGNIILSNGDESDYYYDMRVLYSDPNFTHSNVSQLFCARFKKMGLQYDCLCAVPYGAVPFVSMASVLLNKPMIVLRKERKAHGTRQIVEGISDIKKNRVLLFDDVINSGKSIEASAQVLRNEGFDVVLKVCIVKRNGAPVDIISLIHPITEKLFRLSEHKKSRVIPSLDLPSAKEILQMADLLGPYVCAVKIHFDLIKWTLEDTKFLQQISNTHNFLVIDDRKYMDIARIALSQYRAAPYPADIITVCPMSGPNIVAEFDKAGVPMIIVSSMSSYGTYLEGHISRNIRNNVLFTENVIGLLKPAIENLTQLERKYFTHFSVGFSTSEETDKMGQKYINPELNRSRFMFVGRDIYNSKNPIDKLKCYN